MPPTPARLPSAPARRRLSLRARVALAIVAASIAPLMLVFAWSRLDEPVPERTRARVADAAEEMVHLIREARALPTAALSSSARRHKVRVRVLDRDARVHFEASANEPRDALDPIERYFLDEARAPSLEALDAQRGPLAIRPALEIARQRGRLERCIAETSVVCEVIARVIAEDGAVRYVYVQASSFRAVQAVQSLRVQLGRISLVIVPLAILLAFYTAARVVRPIEKLRAQALSLSLSERAESRLEGERVDEVRSLADSFNVLLAALEHRREQNQGFVTDLVHELKNPLAAVRAVADALEDAPTDAARAKRLSLALRESTTKLDGLATQFLELARAEAGMPDEERAEIDVAALVRGLGERMRQDVRYASVTFVVEADVAAMVRGVASRLEAVFAELFDNAASFAGESGTVTARVELSARDVVIVMHDSGEGISDADLPRVFERFYTTRRHHRGTGLGLALVRAVVAAHGGNVSVRRAEGTEMLVRLPRTRVHTASTSPPRTIHPAS